MSLLLHLKDSIISDDKMRGKARPNYVHFLREKQFTGVVTIVCLNVDDLITVEETLKNCPIEEYHKYEPHNSEDEVVAHFFDGLLDLKLNQK